MKGMALDTKYQHNATTECQVVGVSDVLPGFILAWYPIPGLYIWSIFKDFKPKDTLAKLFVKQAEDCYNRGAV